MVGRPGGSNEPLFCGIQFTYQVEVAAVRYQVVLSHKVCTCVVLKFQGDIYLVLCCRSVVVVEHQRVVGVTAASSRD